MSSGKALACVPLISGLILTTGCTVGGPAVEEFDQDAIRTACINGADTATLAFGKVAGRVVRINGFQTVATEEGCWVDMEIPPAADPIGAIDESVSAAGWTRAAGPDTLSDSVEATWQNDSGVRVKVRVMTTWHAKGSEYEVSLFGRAA